MLPIIRRTRAPLFLALATLALLGNAAWARDVAPQPPSQVFGELFHRVQTERLFPDSKTFADAIPKTQPAEILRRYEASRSQPDFSLEKFVAENFTMPAAAASDFRTAPGEEVRAHVDRLWPELTRMPQETQGYDSLLPLATRFVVPGGRYRELYYWDSYFTMVGLQVSGRDDLVSDMVENFADLIDRFGHIPNGTRTYYLSRSQPPFFAAMVELQAERSGTRALLSRLPQLEREYAFWMEGSEGLAPGAAHRRVVRLADGTLLNRYWDDLAIPRDEAYLEDLETARQSDRPAAQVYRDLRAAAESGWDFGSRWLADGRTLATIRTTEIAPVDLNSLLYRLEIVIARGCKAAKRSDCEKRMSTKARERRRAVVRLMWDEELGAFVDYDWRKDRRLEQVTAATVYPLYFGLADQRQSARVAQAIRASLLAPHGLGTTTERTGQQWDLPNGWAPLNWIAIEGLRRNGQRDLAETITERWVAENVRLYCNTGKLVEKYNVVEAGAGAGGEYPVQDGFGWTNAVLVKLLSIYPNLGARRYEFTGTDCGASTPR
jgi:alpha,alpha-trehalase